MIQNKVITNGRAAGRLPAVTLLNFTSEAGMILIAESYDNKK